MNNIIKRKWNQNSMVIIEDLQGMAFQAESGGHTFQISGIDGEGNAVALSGTPAGVMLRADGQDVTLTCSASEGVISATLPANAYSVPGRFGLTIFLTSDGQKTAIYAAVGTVGKTSSGTVAPPAGSDVVTLVNAIATAVATIPASYTDLMAAVAPTYSTSGLYAVGSYAWYNGKLYRCTTAITSGETWTSGHWTLANLGSDLVDLKSALNYNRDTECANSDAIGNMDSNRIITIKWEHGGIDNATGATNNDGSTSRSRDITYYPTSILTSIKNGSSARLVLIFYTKSGSTYTYSTYRDVSAGSTYAFNHNELYVRFDIRAGLSSAYLVELTGEKYTLIRNIESLNAYTFQYKGLLSSGSDFDNLENQTLYYAQNQSHTHTPIDAAGMVLTLADKSYVALQLFITTDVYNKRIFARRKTNSGWSVWDDLKNNFVANLSNNSSLDTLGFGTTYFKPSDLTITSDPCPTKSGLVYTLGNPDGVGQQIIVTTSSSNNTIYLRRNITVGWGEWENMIPEIPDTRKEISILFVGNSLTQDGIAYLPYLLKNYYPDVSFKFYMWYVGGKTLAEQYTIFTTGGKAGTFSVAENSASWTNYNGSKTMEWVLSNYEFNIVSLQEYFNEKSSYTDSDLTDWNNCRDYITANYTGGNGLEFISLFHAPRRNNSPSMPSGKTTESIFNMTVAGNNLILQKTIADDMIPNGIGIYRALSTDLDDLGEMDHLSYDGTHTQEGLPCLLQTYVTACWLFDRLGMGRSVYGCPLRITEAILDTINVPGANPSPYAGYVITGTDAQNLLAQEVAIKAYKEGKYYVMNNQYVPPNS